MEYEWILAVAYFVLAALCVLQVVLIWRNGHQMLSYRVGFLSMTATWSTIKAVFWVNQRHWDLLLMQIFFRLPTAIEAASYLLFLVFCAKQVHSQHWLTRGYGRRCWAAFFTVNLLSLCSVVGSALLVCRTNASSRGHKQPWQQRASEPAPGGSAIRAEPVRARGRACHRLVLANDDTAFGLWLGRTCWTASSRPRCTRCSP